MDNIVEITTNKNRNIGKFIKTIREEARDDLQYLITDTFEKITLYENKAKEAVAKRRYEKQLK